jgi:hypothetical protein
MATKNRPLRRRRRCVPATTKVMIGILVLMIITACMGGCGMQKTESAAGVTEGPTPMASMQTDLTDWIATESPTELATTEEGFSYVGPTSASTIAVHTDGYSLLYNSPKNMIADHIEVTSPDGMTFAADGLGVDMDDYYRERFDALEAITSANSETNRLIWQAIQDIAASLAEAGVSIAVPSPVP